MMIVIIGVASCCMQQEEASFAPLDKQQQLKEELQDLYLKPPHEHPPKPIKNTQKSPPSNNLNNTLMTIISLIFFTVIVLAVNDHYSKQILSMVASNNSKNIEKSQGTETSSNQELLIKVNEISENEAKILVRLNEMSKLIDSMNQQPLNIVDSDDNDPPSAPNNQLKNEVEAVEKELSVIKYDISTFARTIKKDNLFITSQLTNLKELIVKNGESVDKRPAQPTEQKSKDQRSFEADFATAAPEDVVEERFTSSSENYVDQKYIMDIPKKLYLFNSQKSSYMNELIHSNNQYYAKKSNYEVVILNKTNYKAQLSLKGAEKLQKLISLLEKREKSAQTSNIRYHLQSIIKKLILLTVLKENGGVMTTGEFAITEDFTWIDNIIRNKYVNRGNRGIKPEVVGFYSVDYSFQKVKQNIKPFNGMHPVDKYMITFPALEDYFIAAAPKTRFLNALMPKIAQLLSNPSDFKRKREHYMLNNLKGEDIYYEYFLIAVQTVLQDKQKQIDLANIDKYRHFAIDYYGLNLINCFYAPYKLKSFWGDAQSRKAFQSLSQYPIQQLQANIGPMRYIARITPVEQMNSYLQDTKNGRRKFILEGSFIQKIFYPDSKFPFLRKNQEKSITNHASGPWLGLPKTIWVFWDKGLKNAGVNNQICVENLRKMGKLSGFVVNEVNLSNVHNYLDKQTLDRINYSLQHAMLNIYPQSKADLIRLALLAKHGGIYMDASFMAIESFDWLVNIGKYPSQYIFNRFGSLPRVFMMFHPHYGSPFEWTIDQKFNTKSQWHLAYQNNFIAAQKGSELIAEWFQMLLQLYVQPFNQVEMVFQNCMIFGQKWSTRNWHYLIPMDAIKCVIGRKQAQIRKTASKEYASASDYYKIWSISGYLGQQKLRSNTNFDHPGSQDNKFVYRYSQEYAEGLIGKIRHLVKFYSQHNKELTLFVSKHMDGDFSSQAHPQSIFMRYLWDKSFKLQEVNFQPRLKPLE